MPTPNIQQIFIKPIIKGGTKVYKIAQVQEIYSIAKKTYM